MLYLSKKDISQIVSYNELMNQIEKSFITYETDNFEMPDRIHLHHNDNTILYMPCFTESIFGTKVITVFPNNIKKSLPAIQGIMLLNNVKTGEPLAIIDGASITAFRTGAVGGVGVK